MSQTIIIATSAAHSVTNDAAQTVLVHEPQVQIVGVAVQGPPGPQGPQGPAGDIDSSTWVPYTGATQNIDLGNYSIMANGVLPAPSNVTIQINYGNSGYSTYNTNHGFRVYAYKSSGSARIYSAPADSDIVQDDGYGGGTYVYDLSFGWDAVGGADGYVVFKYDSAAGYIYDYNVEVTSNSLSDNGSSGFYTGSFPTTAIADLPAFGSSYGGVWVGQNRNPAYDDMDVLQFGNVFGASHRIRWSNSSTGNNELQFLNDAGGVINARFGALYADAYSGTSYMTSYGSSFGTHYGSIYTGTTNKLAFFASSGYLTTHTSWVLDTGLGRLGLNTSSPQTTHHVYNGNDSATLTNFTQSLTNTGHLMDSDYVAGNYLPGYFWRTQNDNSTKPKAGIWIQTNSGGSKMFLGTSNSYATGITNQGITVDEAGKVGVQQTTPTAAIDTPASTTAAASLRIRCSGSAPTSPNDGDIWYDGTNLKMRIGSTTKTFTLT